MAPAFNTEKGNIHNSACGSQPRNGPLQDTEIIRAKSAPNCYNWEGLLNEE